MGYGRVRLVYFTIRHFATILVRTRHTYVLYIMYSSYTVHQHRRRLAFRRKHFFDMWRALLYNSKTIKRIKNRRNDNAPLVTTTAAVIDSSDSDPFAASTVAARV